MTEWSEATDVLVEAADRLLEAARSGKPCPPVRETLPGRTAETGYAVQEINTRRALHDGRRLVGRKVGLTSQAVQRQLGVDQPDFGMLFADMAFLDGLPIPTGRFLQPRAEAEIALVLKGDLVGGPFTVAEVIRAVDFALPAIEIVDSRIAGWDITLVDTVADNASSGAFVLGNTPVPLTGLDLRLAGMTMTRRGQEVSTGAGAACLGHPLNAAVWLANALGGRDFPLRAGDIVLTGALGPVVAVEPGDVFEVVIDGLGSVRAVFS
ncbi:2-keto-4-pentenoate hydratase [Streptosporangium roseum]|uniref:2-oxopent-4-enoate hydratase n=1 Tax=Streptosporangium roseum (strain ATCC 12428 / DSM 43021 / JCM 3005 / KCTC 9067 / NCIMB 10171 / NRRL 2505 / NI 9100) TaxID=479432 RepID=D2BAX4_STRRD|nr:fumarylacetoacetate hydrolase family protein [Streptosporangium roseum]ACZ91738.1 2-oxopent-4-enoate hydratase [Streptosporangium roseum DSM 43021]